MKRLEGGFPGVRDIERWAGPLVIAATCLVMLIWSWGTWPDVLVDFGDELYEAWQLASGKTLYRDILHLKGPLSPYLNALWFKLFGVGAQTLVLCNLGILLCVVWLLYRLFSELSERVTATIACAVFLTVFAYGQFVGIGNYNFLCPYSHEVTHGIALSLVAIRCLAAYHRRRRLAPLVGAGFALGLTFLTDGSVFLAAALAVIGGLGLMLWTERPSRPRLCPQKSQSDFVDSVPDMLRMSRGPQKSQSDFVDSVPDMLRMSRGCLVGVFVGSAVVPVLVALSLLSLVLPIQTALHGVLGTWPYTLHEHPFSRKFYQWSMGTDALWTNMGKMVAWSGWYAVVFGPAAGLSLVLRRSGKNRARMAGLLRDSNRITFAQGSRLKAAGKCLEPRASSQSAPRSF
ncbi:MAG: glycosyltransferase family 39 protein [Candidatus Omnitrophica bacterium]|nr:glycosyltransferase family 39 protein [Candidatus Omnitrophota bacterium]